MFDPDSHVQDANSSPAIIETEIEDGNVYCNSVKHTSRAFSLLHVNARSIKTMIHIMISSHIIESFRGKLDLIVVSETWLSSSDPLNMYSMSAYNDDDDDDDVRFVLRFF